MKNFKIRVKKYYCKFCKKELKNGIYGGAHEFCSDSACLDVRREASGTVDLRNNLKIIDHGNGFDSTIPIDPTKLWKASEENKKIVAERQRKYQEENIDE